MCTGHADSMFTRSDCACFMAPNRTISTGCSNYLIRITWRTNNRFLDFAIRVLRSRLCRVGLAAAMIFVSFLFACFHALYIGFQLPQWGKCFTWLAFWSCFVLYAIICVHCGVLYAFQSNRFFIHDSELRSLVIEVYREWLISALTLCTSDIR